MHAVIMAGGKGSRLMDITKGEIPKPMVEILGKPLLLWQIEELKRYGLDRITLIVGYLKEKIIDYFGNGHAFGVLIDYIEEEVPLGTAGAFYYLKDKLESDTFLLVFGDVLFNIDIPRMIHFHEIHGGLATLFVHPNAHPFDSDLVQLGEDSEVIGFDSKHNIRTYWYDNIVNAGFYILEKRICEKVTSPGKLDFEKEILEPMIGTSDHIYAYCSPEYIKDVGTMERITVATEELYRGLVAARNLENPQKAIFLDRDGTINKAHGFIDDEVDFILEDRAIDAIRAINASGYLAIVITNQPVVARGQCSITDLENIHKKMKTLLGNAGAFLDAIYYCPHHPDKGFAGENLAFKMDCDCRKPQTGMIDMAVRDYHIDVEKSYMVGDSTIDMELARRAGIKSVLLETGSGGSDGKFSKESDIVASDILEAVEKICSDTNQK